MLFRSVSKGVVAALDAVSNTVGGASKTITDLSNEKSNISLLMKAYEKATEGKKRWFRQGSLGDKYIGQFITASNLLSDLANKDSEVYKRTTEELRKLLGVRKEDLRIKQILSTMRGPNFDDEPPSTPKLPPLPAERPQHKFIDHFADGLKDIEREIELYDRRRELLSATAAATARANAEAQIMNRLADENITLTNDQRVALDGYLDGLEQASDRLQSAQDQLQLMQEIGQTVASNLESAFSEFVETGQFDFSKMVNSMIADLARLAFQMAVIKPLFGGQGGSGGGGIFGQMLGGAVGGGGTSFAGDRKSVV